MVTEDEFRKLFENEFLLDKSSLSNGTKHIQLSIKAQSYKYFWLDAAYMGSNGAVHFIVSSKNSEHVDVLSFDQINKDDIQKFYDHVKKWLPAIPRNNFTAINIF